MNSMVKFILFLLLLLFVISCARVPDSSMPLFQRSVVVENSETEAAVLSKASVINSNDPLVNNIKIIHVKGTPYEMGFQHGRLLREDIRDSISSVMWKVKLFASEEAMDEVYDLMEPYIPLEEKEEMRGLAHGAGIPLRVVHWFHSIPEVSEYGRKRKFGKWFKGTSCSNIVAFGKATEDSEMYQLRVLDWNRRLGVQDWPVILVHEPDKGNASVSFSYAGFIGCVSGMNSKKLVLGEMGYGNPPGESLEGIPFVFLFRKIMREAGTLEEADKIVRSATRTNSYSYLISDSKIRGDKTNSLLFVSDRQSVETYRENTVFVDKRKGKNYRYSAIDDILFGSARPDEMGKAVNEYYGRISVRALQDIAKRVSLKGNMQNVIFKPGTLETWVTNATTKSSDDDTGRASNQKWFYFDFGRLINQVPGAELN